MIKFIRRAAALAVLPVIAAGAVATMSTAPAEATATQAAQVVNLTNAQRVKHGCPRVRVNTALARSAILHSRDMATRNYFSHTSPGGRNFVTRARLSGYKYAMSENIAWGQTTPAAVMNAWLKSPGHRANIMNCKAKSVGVGVAYNRRGVPYWTQVFGRV